MRNFIFGLLLIAQSAFSANNAMRVISTATLDGITVQRNIVTDPGFERGGSTWTASGGATHTVNTTAALIGSLGYDWDSNASGQTLTSAAVTIPPGLQGANGVFGCKIKTVSGTATTTIAAYDGTTAYNAQTINSVAGQSLWTFVNMILPSSGTLAVQLKSVASNEPELYIDQCFISDASTFNVSQVNQAQFIGSAYIPVTASCTWSRTNTALGAFSTTSACPGPTIELNPGPGIIQTTDTDLPQFTVNNLAPGYCEVSMDGRIDGASSGRVNLAINDGTTTSGRFSAIPTSSTSAGFHVVGNFNYTTAGNHTFALWGSQDTGAMTVNDSEANNQLYFSIKCFPSQSQQAYKPDVVPGSYAGTMVGAGGGWSTSSGQYVDYSVASTSNTLTTVATSINMSCVADAGKGPIIDCTMPRLGNYWVCASGSIGNSSASAGVYARLVDGSGTIINGGVLATVAGTNGVSPFNICGKYNVTSLASTSNFKVQGGASSGTASINQSSATPITWTVFELDAPMPAPYLTGSVTSNSPSTGFHSESATFNLSGASTVSITNQSGTWVSSATASSTQITANFPAGEFSAAPTCNVTCLGNLPVINTAATSSSITFCCYNLSGSCVTASAVSLQCQGPR
jgi:hypothetical protein